MAARRHRSRRIITTAAVLFLPAAGVLAVCYGTFERPAKPPRPNELVPSEAGRGLALQGGLATPAVASAESGPGNSQVPETLERGSQFDALEARRLLPQPWMPPERRDLR